MSPFLSSMRQVESGYAVANWEIVNQYNGQVFKNYNWCSNQREALAQAEKFSKILYEEWCKNRQSTENQEVPAILLVDIRGDEITIYNNKSFWDSKKKVVKLEDVMNRKKLS